MLTMRFNGPSSWHVRHVGSTPGQILMPPPMCDASDPSASFSSSGVSCRQMPQEAEVVTINPAHFCDIGRNSAREIGIVAESAPVAESAGSQSGTIRFAPASYRLSLVSPLASRISSRLLPPVSRPASRLPSLVSPFAACLSAPRS